MDIRVNVAAGSVDIAHGDDLKRLQVSLIGTATDDQATALLGALGRLDGEHAWLRVETLREQAGPGQPEWNEGFTRMIEFARSHGWTTEDDAQVRAHVVRE